MFRVAARRLRLGLVAVAGALALLGQLRGAPASETLGLTAEEVDWIKSHRVVKVGFSAAYAPFSMPDANGKMEGIDLDYLELIARRTGLVFQPVVYPDWPAAEEAFKAGNVDLLTALVGSAEQQASMRLAGPYLMVPAVIVSRTSSPYLLQTSDLRGLRMGDVKGYTAKDSPNRELSSRNVITLYDRMDELFDALARGEIDATITDSINAAYHIKSRHLTNLRLGSVIHGPSGLYFGTQRSQPLLAGIVDKAVNAITPVEKRAIDERWVSVDISPSRWQLAFKIAAGLGLASLVVFSLLYVHNLRLRRELEERRRIQLRLEEALAHVALINEQKSALNTDLQAANAELEAFSSSVSHDLRAPLRNVTGFLELLALQKVDQTSPETARLFGVLNNEVTRMSTLIDALLAFARMGKAELKQEPIELAPLVAEARAFLASAIGTRIIRWEIGALPRVQADGELMRQALINLLGNAVKFTGRCAEARIEIGALTAADGEPMCTIFVRDNGAGFNPKYAAKLFGVFQRLHGTREFEGTGIGLANVKRIITRHGGRIWAEGEIGRGATFYFTLPRAT